jgi:4-amino-4-deoxy-L-arabinose transferase-like glycosyltransferase
LQPPLYYLLGAPFIAWLNPQSADALPASNPFAQIGIPRADTNDNRNAFLHAFDTSSGDGAALAVHLLRLYSTLLGACTIILTYCIARELFPTTAGLWLLAAAFVAFLPQFLFISGAISNDNLATALSVAVLWQSAVTMRVGLSPLRAAGLGALVGAALLTKLNTIALAAVVLFAFAYIVMIKKQTRAIIIGGAVFSAMVVFIAGWWYWRNVQLYGDPTAFSLIAQLVGERPAPPGFWQW